MCMLGFVFSDTLRGFKWHFKVWIHHNIQARFLSICIFVFSEKCIFCSVRDSDIQSGFNWHLRFVRSAINSLDFAEAAFVSVRRSKLLLNWGKSHKKREYVIAKIEFVIMIISIKIIFRLGFLSHSKSVRTKSQVMSARSTGSNH